MAAKPESVIEHLPRSNERSLQQLAARLARLEREYFDLSIFGEVHNT